MADEDDELPQEETPEPRLFTLTEAERTRRELEPVLIEAMDCRRKLSGLDTELAAVAARIMMMGGILVDRDRALASRTRRDETASRLRNCIEAVLETGCLVKDLDIGLIDFLAQYQGRDVYLCWKLGEERIAWWHGIEEGFRGRKPIDEEFLKGNASETPN